MNFSRLKKVIIFGTTFFLFPLFANKTFACGPSPLYYFFTPEDVEEINSPFFLIDLERFLNSHYEIISSGWCPQSLYPVYRELTNNKITAEEKEQLSRYFRGQFYNTLDQVEEAIAIWKEARKLVTDEDVEIKTFKCDNYDCYINCLPDAFLTAANVLKERSKVYTKEELKIWLQGQDRVFSNCGKIKEGALPPSLLTASAEQSLGYKIKLFFLKIKNFFAQIFNKIFAFFKKLLVKKKPEEKPTLPQQVTSQDLLKYDQEYQIASEYFYKGKLDEAEKKFQEIAKKKDHPWRPYAELVLARIYIRRAQGLIYFLYGREDREEVIKKRNELLEKAKIQLENILKDESLKLVHEGARSLLNFVNFRIDTPKRFEEAENVLLGPHNPKEMVENLEDFSLLFSNQSYLEIQITKKIEKEDILKNGKDLSQWIYVWKNPNENNLEFALKKYQESKSLPWLLASLKLMTLYQPDHPLRDEILSEVSKISNDSPAYLTANYYRLKLLLKTEKPKEEIRGEIDKILKTIPPEFAMARNYFNDLMMLAANDLKESLSYSLRRVLAFNSDYVLSRETEEIYFIDNKAKRVFNEFLPLKKWVEITSDNNIFPLPIANQIRVIAFVRSVLLEDFATAEKLANLLISTDPTQKEQLLSFVQAKSDEEKKFAAALYILKHPSLDYVLDSKLESTFGENWWCEYPPTYDYDYKPYDLTILQKLISPEEIQEAKQENEKIYRIVAPNYLSEVVINYALKHPQDPRVPEALHLAVEATRFATCKDERTGEFSQRAFQILHEKYPNNYWTNETPYWYR